MLDKVKPIIERYEEIDKELETVGADYQRAADLSKEKSDIEPVVTAARSYAQALEELEEAQELTQADDEEMAELARAEIERLETEIARLENKLKSMLVPKDPRDQRNVIMEIRAGTGGDEAAIFAADLFRLYTRYAERQRWQMEILSQHDIGVGGFKEITSFEF